MSINYTFKMIEHEAMVHAIKCKYCQSVCFICVFCKLVFYSNIKVISQKSSYNIYDSHYYCLKFFVNTSYNCFTSFKIVNKKLISFQSWWVAFCNHLNETNDIFIITLTSDLIASGISYFVTFTSINVQNCWRLLMNHKLSDFFLFELFIVYIVC